jgi:phosphoribosylformylglycinamidine cyclo-ligase
MTFHRHRPVGYEAFGDAKRYGMSTYGEYERHGVSAEKTDVKSALEHTDKGLIPSAFCRVLPDLFCGDPNYVFAVHADGAGTKSSLAYLYYRRHRDPSVFRGIAHDALVMNLDDLLCIGATGPFALSNTIGRNAGLVPAEVLHEIIRGYDEAIRMLAEYDITIVPCGGETADLGDLVRTLVVDATLATRLPRSTIIDAGNVEPGLEIVGLSSFDRCEYESEYNSGIGSNGLTLARHKLLVGHTKEVFPETYDPAIADLVYTGSFDIDDPLPGTPLSVGKALLSPTRTYAPVVKKILEIHDRRVAAIFHNTGGGQTKCLSFGHGIRYVKDNTFSLAPIFRLLRTATDLTSRELARVFNLGHRMEIVCQRSFSQDVIGIARSFGIAAQVIGHIEAEPGPPSLVIVVEGEEIRFP